MTGQFPIWSARIWTSVAPTCSTRAKSDSAASTLMELTHALATAAMSLIQTMQSNVSVTGRIIWAIAVSVCPSLQPVI